ncbi:unnamed protein product [Nezara viridula]|uniref:Uncharacterized protein n=1 Tax=Nezara viridula TaxID=85310 RepID=A0A9P0HV04_NEZVI|nr:unnamed protein product [Nezara viridula]
MEAVLYVCNNRNAVDNDCGGRRTPNPPGIGSSVPNPVPINRDIAEDSRILRPLQERIYHNYIIPPYNPISWPTTHPSSSAGQIPRILEEEFYRRL